MLADAVHVVAVDPITHETGRHEEDDLAEEVLEELPSAVESVFNCVLLIAAGTVLLAFGAEILVGSAIELAEQLNVSKIIIGLTVVAIGTSLPELAASISAARRRQSSICAGNIVGSNLFNLLFVGGSVSMVKGLDINADLQVEFLAMLLMTALLWLMFTTNKRVTRLEGFILLIIYGIILGLSAVSHNAFSFMT